MYLKYSELPFDVFGRPDTPDLILMTLSGRELGVLSGVHNLKLNIKYSEPSEMSFDIPSVIDGIPNPLYDKVTGRKLIYTKHYGVYVTMNPIQDSDGVSDIKSVQCYSIEKRLDDKRFFLEKGTYRFWNPLSREDTLLGRILECAPGWTVGHVDTSLWTRYRTFDQYDDYLLSFIYNTAPEKFRCVFVFDPYGENGKKTINVYDMDTKQNPLQIYLDFDNLIEEVKVEEMSNELVTALEPYGADGLDIRGVNPIGSNWIYDLSHYTGNGDIDADLADKWNRWQLSIRNNQELYRALVALRASVNVQMLTKQTEKAEVEAQIEEKQILQNVEMEAIASGLKTSEGSNLGSLKESISSLRNQIDGANGIASELKALTDEYNSLTEEIEAIVGRMRFTNTENFSEAEQAELVEYFIEQDLVDDTFIATSVDTNISGESFSLDGGLVSVKGSKIVEVNLSNVNLSSETGKTMYTMAGGTIDICEKVSADIIRGTIEKRSDGGYVLSLYAGTITVNDKSAQSGLITITGSISGDIEDDIKEKNDSGVVTFEGENLSFTSSSGTMFLTANVSDFQRYSVQMELFEFATKALHDMAVPTYEFSVSSGNFLFAQEFEPFRNELKLGRPIYLNIGHELINPVLLEIAIDFEDHSSFDLVFSNRFQRKDGVNILRDMIEEGYSSGRSFDASKYIYGQVVQKTTAIDDYMESLRDAAVNTINGARDQSVTINGAGINIGQEGSDYQMRLVNSMLAITSDGWQSVDTAIGKFQMTQDGENVSVYGINTQLLSGIITITKNLIIQNYKTDGNGNPTNAMQFEVGPAGVFMDNATFVLNSDTGAQMFIDPDHGFAAGTSGIYTLNGTEVTPLIYKEDGVSINDNVNFYINPQTGKVFFRGDGEFTGKIKATDSEFTGKVTATDSEFTGRVTATSGQIGDLVLSSGLLHSGDGDKYVAINGGETTYGDYAFWAGAENPAEAEFWVKKNGEASFAGTVKVGDLVNEAGESILVGGRIKSNYLSLDGIDIGNGNFRVNGNEVTINGKVTMGKGSTISWDEVGHDPWAEDARTALYGNYDEEGNNDGSGILVPGTTMISWNKIQSPEIVANIIRGGVVEIQTDAETTVGTIKTENTSAGVGFEMYSTSGGVKLYSTNGNVWIEAGSGAGLLVSNGGYVSISSGGLVVQQEQSWGSLADRPANAAVGWVYFATS